MGPTWVLSAPDGPHVCPMDLAIRITLPWTCLLLLIFPPGCVTAFTCVGHMTLLVVKPEYPRKTRPVPWLPVALAPWFARIAIAMILTVLNNRVLPFYVQGIQYILSVLIEHRECQYILRCSYVSRTNYCCSSSVPEYTKTYRTGHGAERKFKSMS